MFKARVLYNMAYGLKVVRGIREEERITAALQAVSSQATKKRDANTLSGGKCNDWLLRGRLF